MKRILLLTAIAVSALTACQKAETTITFNLTDLPEGTVIEILKWNGDEGETVFVARQIDGTFCITYPCDSITEYSVNSNNGSLNSDRHIFIKGNCNTTVTGSGFYAENWNIESENPRQQFSNKFNDATKDIKIEYEYIEPQNMVSITIIDEGKAFDPLKRNDPDVTLSAEDRDIGGLGLFIVKKTMDEVTYKRLNNKNVLILKKKI